MCPEHARKLYGPFVLRATDSTPFFLFRVILSNTTHTYVYCIRGVGAGCYVVLYRVGKRVKLPSFRFFGVLFLYYHFCPQGIMKNVEHNYVHIACIYVHYNKTAVKSSFWKFCDTLPKLKKNMYVSTYYIQFILEQ